MSLSADHQSSDKLLLPNKWQPKVLPFLVRLYQLFSAETPMIGIEIQLADPVIFTRLGGNPQLLAICCTRVNVFIAMWPNLRQSEFFRECGAEPTGFLENEVD